MYAFSSTHLSIIIQRCVIFHNRCQHFPTNSASPNGKHRWPQLGLWPHSCICPKVRPQRPTRSRDRAYASFHGRDSKGGKKMREKRGEKRKKREKKKERKNEKWMNEWMNRWINEWMNEWMNEWLNEWNNREHEWWTRWVLMWFQTFSAIFHSSVIDQPPNQRTEPLLELLWPT